MIPLNKMTLTHTYFKIYILLKNMIKIYISFKYGFEILVLFKNRFKTSICILFKNRFEILNILSIVGEVNTLSIFAKKNPFDTPLLVVTCVGTWVKSYG